MASATVVARQTGSTTTNAGTHSVTFPAGVTAGELLLAFVASDGGPIIDDSSSLWTKIAGQHRNTTNVAGAVLAKIADGSDTLTVRTRVGDASSTEMISWVTMRISGHGGLPVGAGANGSSTNSDPPALTPPWGSQDYLWIAARMGDAQVPATAVPTGYATLTGVTHSSINGACVHTAEKSSTASTENPGTFTSATEQWAALTIAVPPSTITTPQLVAKYEVVTVTSTTASIASPSFTPADNEVLVVKTSTADGACVPSTPTATGVTFTPQASAGNSPGSLGWARVCTAALGTSPGAITVTQAFTGTGFVRSMVVERWKNAKLDATPAVAQSSNATASAPNASVTTEAANSIVTWVNTDWQAVAPGSYLYRTANTNEDGIFDVTTTDVCAYFAYQYAPTAAAQALGLTAPATQSWALAGVEIQYQAPVSPPVADAGADASGETGTAFTRTGTGTNTPTSYSWSLTSAPGGVTTGVVDSDADLSYTPTVVGTYVFQLTATNAGGSGTDSFTLTVTAPSGGTTYTLGKTDAGTTSSASSANKAAVSKFTAANSGTLTAGHARAWLTGASTGTKVVVYADSGGAPGALLAASSELVISNTTEQVLDYTFSGGSIVSGTDYWVGLSWADPGTDSLNLGRDNTAGGRQEVNSYAPDPFGTPSALTGPVAVWVEYTSGGGGGGTTDYAAPVIEHSGNYASTSGNMTADPVTVPFGGTAVAGELCLVCFAGDKNTGTLSVTDNIGSGWTVEASIPGASVSVYIAWKVAVGGETGAVCNMGTSPISGVSGYGAILSQEGSHAWGVCCEAVPTYSDTARSAASSGTSGAATYRGRAFAVCGVDSSSNAPSGSWSNGYSAVYSPTTVGDTGGAPAWTATAVVERGATTETTFTKTGTTDQMTTTLVVFGRQGLGSSAFTPRGAFFPFMYG